MIRPLFTFASTISLLLCISIAVGGLIYTPGQFTGIYFGDGTWGATVGNGIISPYHANRIIVSVPVSALAVPFAILPLAWCWRTWRREQWRKRGRCAACGYDLRASVGKCPECGIEIRADAPQAIVPRPTN